MRASVDLPLSIALGRARRARLNVEETTTIPEKVLVNGMKFAREELVAVPSAQPWW